MLPVGEMGNTVILYILASVLKLSELDNLWDVLYPEIRILTHFPLILYFSFFLAFLNSVFSLFLPHRVYLANAMNGFLKSRTFYLFIHLFFTTGAFLFCFAFWIGKGSRK